jgi:uncharacterized protein
MTAGAAEADLSGSEFAARLRGLGPVGIIAALLILLSGNLFLGDVAVPLGGMLVLLWVRLSRTPWREIGYARPRSWVVAVAGGTAFGIAFKFLMKAIVMPLFGADPVNHAFHYLAGNRAALPAAVWAMFAAGFGEETVFRGFLFERLGKLFGDGAGAKIVTVLLTAGTFGAAHYQLQGMAGVEQATIVGLVLGAIYAVTKRLPMLMCAHAAFDLTAVAIIYWNAEADVAHLVFR